MSHRSYITGTLIYYQSYVQHIRRSLLNHTSLSAVFTIPFRFSPHSNCIVDTNPAFSDLEFQTQSPRIATTIPTPNANSTPPPGTFTLPTPPVGAADPLAEPEASV